MATGEGWDPEKMLDLYLHDYLVKRKLYKAASIFKREANVCDHSCVIDTPEGFLIEWWSIFHDLFFHRLPEPQKTLQAMQMKEIEQPTFQTVGPSLARNQPTRPEQFPRGNGYDNMLGHISQPAMDFDPGLGPTNLSKPGHESLSLLQTQMFKQDQQGAVKRNRISLGTSSALDPMLNGSQSDTFSVSRPHGAGMSKGVNIEPPNGWPVNTPNNQQQFQMLSSDCQQPLLAQSLSIKHGKRTAEPGSSANFCSSNLMLSKSEVKGEDGQNGRKRKAASCSRTGENPMDCIKAKERRLVHDNVETFFSHDGDHTKSTDTSSNVLKLHATGGTKYEHQGFTFDEVGCLHSSKSKVLCCHFSSDGKLLASAGHEKKVFIWNVETFEYVSTSERHTSIITDVKFQPSSTIFATSSFDRAVKIWDATRPSKSPFNLLGHSEQVMSLDFHPTKVDLLCSCDTNDDIRLWNVKQSTCTHMFKGATSQVRFEPCSGNLLATASGNGINLFDIETGRLQLSWKAHVKDVLSLCWNYNGKYILSVSEDSARVWSTSSGGKCIYELHANGNKFRSCTFHPGYDSLWIIGGYQNLELWNPDYKQTSSITAHNGLVAALAGSYQTRIVASASHDQCVKIWK